MSVDIHLCRSDEIADLMSFIHEHWAQNHILSFDHLLMDWQHKNIAGPGYCYVLARANDDNKILGVLGFISTKRYDSNLASDNMLWIALWKTRDDCKISGLGLMVLQYVVECEPHQSIGIVGVGSESHFNLYNALGYTTGRFDQFFILNPNFNRFKIAVIPENFSPSIQSKGTSTFKRLHIDDLLDFEARFGQIDNRRSAPTKTPIYFLNRFLKHPIYKYSVYLARVGDRAVGLLAVRLCEFQGAKALRMIDWYGDNTKIGEIGHALMSLLEKTNAEFADIWSVGLDHDRLKCAGFHLVDPYGPIIIPTYFEPFIQENGELLYAFKTNSEKPPVLFKADGDQDRPNIIEKRSQSNQTSDKI